MSPSDRIVKIEMSKIEQLVALGLGRYEAIAAVEAGVDMATVESLVTEKGSPGPSPSSPHADVLRRDGPPSVTCRSR